MKVITLIIIGSILFISLLGLRGLCEPDEGRYAEISREMTEKGNWLEPHLNYIKHFHKPPFLYWVVAASFSCFGTSEFTGRLPVAIFGVLGLIVTYFLSIRMGLGKRAGFLSGIILATTMQYFIWTQILTSDLVFSFFILLALYGFWTRRYILYLGIALAFMIKGPVAVIIPALVIGIYILITKEWGILREMKVVRGMLLFLAIVSPWFIYVCMKNPGLAGYFVFYQSLDRLLTDVHGRGGNIFYFIPIALLGGLPWIVFIPWTLRIKDKTNLFLFLWIIIPIIFFSFSSSKLPGYILPVYPALAIVTGSYFERKRGYSLVSVLSVIFAVLYLTAVAVLPKFEERLEENLSIRRPASIIKKHGSRGDKIINYRCFLQGLPFYLGKRIILVEKKRETQFETDKNALKDYLIPGVELLFDKLEGDERIWCFTKVKHYSDLLQNSPVPLFEIWRTSDYMLVSNRPVADI